MRRTADDGGQIGMVVKLQTGDDAETVAQRIGQHARAGGRADQREWRQVDFHRTGGRAFAYHDVELVVFQSGIQDFFHHGAEAVDFVDEQYVVRFEVGQERGQIARAFQHRAAGLAQVHTQFFGDDVGQRGFAQTRRAEKQRVVECFAALFGCLDKDF